MALKPQDFLTKINDEHPHAVVEVEMDESTEELTLRNVVRLEDDEAKDVSDAMSIFRIINADPERDDVKAILDEVLSDEEQEKDFTRVLVERIIRALRAAAEDKELYDEFIEGARTKYKGDFKQFILRLFSGYREETRLGEAGGSENS